MTYLLYQKKVALWPQHRAGRKGGSGDYGRLQSKTFRFACHSYPRQRRRARLYRMQRARLIRERPLRKMLHAGLSAPSSDALYLYELWRLLSVITKRRALLLVVLPTARTPRYSVCERRFVKRRRPAAGARAMRAASPKQSRLVVNKGCAPLRFTPCPAVRRPRPPRGVLCRPD
jgi:hypothetical protein